MMTRNIERWTDGATARAVLGCWLALAIVGAPPTPAQVVDAGLEPEVRATIVRHEGDTRLAGDAEWAPECPQVVCMSSKRACIQDPDCCGGIDCIKVPTSLPVFYRFDPNGIWTIQSPTAGVCGLRRPEFWKICGPPLLNATCQS